MQKGKNFVTAFPIHIEITFLPLSCFPRPHFKKYLFIYLFERQNYEERWRDSTIMHLLVHSSDDPKDRAGPRQGQKPGTRSYIWVSHVGGRGLNSWVIVHYSPRSLQGNWIRRSWAAGTWIWYIMNSCHKAQGHEKNFFLNLGPSVYFLYVFQHAPFPFICINILFIGGVKFKSRRKRNCFLIQKCVREECPGF